MALGRVSDLRKSSFLLSKGCAAFRGRSHLEARTACRSETNIPLVLILGQSPSTTSLDPPGAKRGDLVRGHEPYHDILEEPHEPLAMDRRE